MPQEKDYLPDPQHVVQTINVGARAAVAMGVGEAAAVPSFQILRTNEVDPYEAKLPSAMVEATAVASAALSDNFAGNDRKAAKISIAHGGIEDFDDVGKLLDSLVAEKEMIAHDPKILIDEHSDRVDEEERNVRVKAWLYAASREKDNDFHTIIGRDPAKKPRRYMNAEVSGLPSKKSSAFKKLSAARAAFKAIVHNNLPGLGYDFYNPPIPIIMEGSLFFDMTHSKGGKPGPQKVKPGTIWELHPVTGLKPRKP